MSSSAISEVMLKFLDQTSVADEFKALKAEPNDIRIAVAFWGNGSRQALGLDRVCKKAKILCNLQSGACNPSEIRALIEESEAEVRTCERLHSKVYLTSKAVIVGSSNASANGLAYEGGELNGWQEANIITNSQGLLAEISEWFDCLWDQAIPVKVASDLFKDAEVAWSKRRAKIPFTTDPSGILDAFRLRPGKFSNVFLAIHDQPLDEAAESRRKKVAEGKAKVGDLPLKLGNELWAYQDWEAIPDGAWLIDIDASPNRKQPHYSGYAKVHDPAVTDKQKKFSLTYAIRQSRNRKGVMVEGYPQPLKLAPEDEKIISRHIKSLFPNDKDNLIGGKLISLSDAVQIIDRAELKLI